MPSLSVVVKDSIADRVDKGCHSTKKTVHFALLKTIKGSDKNAASTSAAGSNISKA